MANQGKRSKISRLLSQQRDRRDPRESLLPDSLWFRIAWERHVMESKEDYREAKAAHERGEITDEELADWQPRGTDRGRAGINEVLTEIRLASLPEERAAKEREDLIARAVIRAPGEGVA